MLTAETSTAAGAHVRPPQDETITRAEFARRIGVSKPAVTQAVSAGRLHGPALADGKRLRFQAAAEQWKANRDPQADLKPGSDDGVDETIEPGDAAPGSYRSEKAESERVRRQLLEIDLGRAQDRYRDRDEVERAMVTAGRQIAQHLELIESWSDELAAETDPMAVRRLLRNKIRDLRQQVADALVGIEDEDEDDTDASESAAAPAAPAVPNGHSATEDSEHETPKDA